MPGLKEKYTSGVVAELREERGIANPLQVPRVQKVVVNMGFGVVDKETLKSRTEILTAITGQKPITTKARKSISNFKLRAGMIIGAKVTLRGDRMYEFLDRLISATLPRIRDFRGVPGDAFDGRGNYSLGIREVTIFPEIDPNKVSDNQGLDITIVTSTNNDDEARALLEKLGMPFAKK